MRREWRDRAGGGQAKRGIRVIQQTKMPSGIKALAGASTPDGMLYFLRELSSPLPRPSLGAQTASLQCGQHVRQHGLSDSRTAVVALSPLSKQPLRVLHRTLLLREPQALRRKCAYLSDIRARS